ncbi:type II/IV secretion system protein, partial [Pseudomonas sp. MH2]|nr:type II/IV secretion system protein [Pseudomonas sp. MH2]
MHNPHDHSLDLKRLLDTLLAEHRLAPGDALRALEHAASQPGHPLEVLASLALSDCLRPGHTLDLDTLCQWLAERVGQPFLRLDPLQVDLARVAGLISPAFAQRHGILAVALDATGITVASAQPYQREWEADLSRSLGQPIRRVLASPVQLRQLGDTFQRLSRSVQGAHQQQRASLGELEQLLELGGRSTAISADDAHIVHIVDWLLQYAIEQRASDIHLEPHHDEGRLRYRIDGLLHTVYQFPAGVVLALVSR